MDYEAYGGEPPYVASSDTSKAASRSMRGSANVIRERIYSFLQLGATCDYVEQELGLRHQTASARIRELFLAGRIESIGTRATRSGRMANVWRQKAHDADADHGC